MSRLKEPVLPARKRRYSRLVLLSARWERIFQWEPQIMVRRKTAETVASGSYRDGVFRWLSVR